MNTTLTPFTPFTPFTPLTSPTPSHRSHVSGVLPPLPLSMSTSNTSLLLSSCRRAWCSSDYSLALIKLMFHTRPVYQPTSSPRIPLTFSSSFCITGWLYEQDIWVASIVWSPFSSLEFKYRCMYYIFSFSLSLPLPLPLPFIPSLCVLSSPLSCSSLLLSHAPPLLFSPPLLIAYFSGLLSLLSFMYYFSRLQNWYAKGERRGRGGERRGRGGGEEGERRGRGGGEEGERRGRGGGEEGERRGRGGGEEGERRERGGREEGGWEEDGRKKGVGEAL